MNINLFEEKIKAIADKFINDKMYDKYEKIYLDNYYKNLIVEEKDLGNMISIKIKPNRLSIDQFDMDIIELYVRKFGSDPVIVIGEDLTVFARFNNPSICNNKIKYNMILDVNQNSIKVSVFGELNNGLEIYHSYYTGDNPLGDDYQIINNFYPSEIDYLNYYEDRFIIDNNVYHIVTVNNKKCILNFAINNDNRTLLSVNKDDILIMSLPPLLTAIHTRDSKIIKSDGEIKTSSIDYKLYYGNTIYNIVMNSEIYYIGIYNEDENSLTEYTMVNKDLAKLIETKLYKSIDNDFDEYIDLFNKLSECYSINNSSNDVED